jgi:hypothetical protein
MDLSFYENGVAQKQVGSNRNMFAQGFYGPKYSIKTWTFPTANEAKFFVETWFPKTNESKFLKKYGFSRQMSPNSSKEIWFSHHPILFSANHDPKESSLGKTLGFKSPSP